MALQGTIDTFALEDVLRLLASTSKTGKLSLSGERGRGDVEVIDGRIHRIVVGEPDRADDLSADEALFELFRFTQGAFEFAAGDVVPEGDGHEVDPLIDEAGRLLEEWEHISTILPSPQSWLTLVPELAADEVTIDGISWRALAVIGSGATHPELADRLGTTELAAGRVVRELVEMGVVSVGEPVTVEEGAVDIPAPTTEVPADAVESGSVGEPPASWFDDSSWHTEASDNGDDAGLTYSVVDHDDDEAAAEFARHLANLSPRAAKAVAAAAQAESPEERDRVLAEVEATEDLDHDLLLRFLGTSER